MNPQTRYHRLAWAMLAYLGFVILYGAVVRITGSGAGCGQHWPTCHGEVLHLPQSVETTIELTHRLTSGLTLPLALVMAVMAMRRFEKGHLVRRAAWGTVLFLVIEALIGARLVLLGLVGLNDSFPRAYWMAAHLTSTCLLTGSAGVMVWGSSPNRPSGTLRRAFDPTAWSLIGALVIVYVIAATGAITALGDTLYPVAEGTSVGATLAASTNSTAHFLEQARSIHPILAVVGGLWVLQVGVAIPGRYTSDRCRRLGNLLAGLVVAQVAAGGINIYLDAPGWLQVIHLALACSVWLALVFLTLEVLALGPATGRVAAPPTAQTP